MALLAGAPVVEEIVEVVFSLACMETRWGESIRVVGNVEELGQWDVVSGAPLHSDVALYPLWAGRVSLRAPVDVSAVAVEYKYVLVSRDGATWESGISNRKIVIPVNQAHGPWVIRDLQFDGPGVLGIAMATSQWTPRLQSPKGKSGHQVACPRPKRRWYQRPTPPTEPEAEAEAEADADAGSEAAISEAAMEPDAEAEVEVGHEEAMVIASLLRAETRWGEEVRLVGNHEALGMWAPEKGVLLGTSPSTYPEWSGRVSLTLPTGGSGRLSVEYKYVLDRRALGGGFIWENCIENRALAVPEGSSSAGTLLVRDLCFDRHGAAPLSLIRGQGPEEVNLAMLSLGPLMSIAKASTSPHTLAATHSRRVRP
mmetsp:Transcript_119172/g.254226  ORF Transcript_119172/g.254226 Transcript_119172/m.254226 type:complete len:369 (+) Transcript_119172:66-1172(+)